MSQQNTYGILVGGGPAPGINSVISAVTIEASKRGHKVLGIHRGYQHLMEGQAVVEELTPRKVQGIHLLGGSVLHTSRANPTKNPQDLNNTLNTLQDLGITHLVSIGGDDTLYSATTVANTAKKERNFDLRFVHVPKTIDNDLPLPAGVPTFGYETARSAGSQLVSTYMQDAVTCGRWYVVVAMGRKTGHLALGIGKSASATLTLIPEEFDGDINLETLTDIIVASMIKRRAVGIHHGVAIVAEGFLEYLDEQKLASMLTSHQAIEHDAHGHLRLSELNFSDLLKFLIKKRLEQFGIKIRIVDQEIGYELRCVGPCAFDIDYTRNLGFGAVNFLEEGGSNAMISIQGESFVPLTFEQLQDPETQKTRVRHVDKTALPFKIARQYMDRLSQRDLDNSSLLTQLARTTQLSEEQFKQEFNRAVLCSTPAAMV